MSSGKDQQKARGNKVAHGWEEAGGEFYQESFPTDLDGAVITRDPTALATLLPSKQNRAATTKRVRRDRTAAGTSKQSGGNTAADRCTNRKHSISTSRQHHSSIRRGSQFHEVHIAMLPDLSENLTDEERIWEEIHEIKSMPVSMAQKRDMKAQLQNATKLRLQGFDQFKWQRRKVCQQFHAKWSEWWMKMALWRNSLKTIEGNCGTGVVAYFHFLRWLICLNLSIFILILLFIVLPQIILSPTYDGEQLIDACNIERNSTECCFYEYYTKKSYSDVIVWDLIQGKRFMEKTIMFYGMYAKKVFGTSILPMDNGYVPQKNVTSSNTFVDTQFIDDESINSNYTIGGEQSSSIPLPSFLFSSSSSSSINPSTESNGILDLKKLQFYYNLPLAYLSVNVVFLLMSLIAIVKSVSREFKDRMVEGEGQFYQYCNLVFGGWDFCIHNQKSAHIKHKALLNEIKGLLQSKRMELERCNRPKDLMFKLIMIRLLVNLIVCVILLAAAWIIFESINYSVKAYDHAATNLYQSGGSTSSTSYSNIENGNESSEDDDENKDNHRLYTLLYDLFIEFLPYITIVCMNFLVPLLFNYLVQFEQYSPMFVIKITLLRTVFLRLSSLGVLLSRFHYLITKKFRQDNGQCNSDYGPLQCWETFVGQQFYKLLVVDFVTHVFVTLFINFPRAMLARHINSRFTRFIGEQEFELSKHVLDIVYSQTICWLGTFYSPFIPATAVVLHFGMFYVKKFACLINSKPSAILYRASRSNSLFMLVLLLSYVLAVIPIVYAAAEIMPSRPCGPFRGLNSVWDEAINAFRELPLYLQKIIFFFGTATFAVPCFVILILCLYYYYAVSAANKHMVEMLKNQLVLEGHDKQFLLNRLSSFLKQQQDYQKKMEHNSSIPPQPPPREPIVNQ
ncbi:transmembrane channel-like protein 7 [Contarinia nasturtii]|uniref:transmembrane channel-like protein 7 n=1 Tax=Contarinia nasturtii TaxID=265458 RepID=UPI0012D3DD51|nr:transmembrane channel-like protein 7 [Contarinia nasturtii]